MSDIGNVEINEVTLARIWYCHKQPLHEIAMRIEQRQASAAPNILPGEILQQRGLSGSGLPDDVRVRSPVGLFDAEPSPIVSEVNPAQEGQPLSRRMIHVSRMGDT